MATLAEELDIQLAAFATVVGDDMQALEALTGALVDLQTQDKTNLVAAINEVFFNIGNLSALTTSQKTSLVLATNELVTSIGDKTTLSTSEKSSIVGAINEIFTITQDIDSDILDIIDDIGLLSDLDTTDKSEIVASINEVLTRLGNIDLLTTSDKTSAVSAINEVKVLTEDNDTAINAVDDKVDDNTDEILLLAGLIGVINDLNTVDKTNLVRAVNEVLGYQGSLADLNTVNKADLVLAINEVWERANKSSFWGGAWQSKTWLYNEMSREGNWLGIVNNTLGTTDHLEPQNSGEEEDSIDDTVVFSQANNTSIIKQVHILTFTEEGFSIKLDVKAVEAGVDTVDRITVWNKTKNIIQIYNNVVLGSDAWTLITASQHAISIGDVLEIWFEIYNSTLASSVDGVWNSKVDTGAPLTSDFNINSLTSPTVIEISHTDVLSADRSTELDGIGVGSIITIAETGDLARNVEVKVSAIDTADANSTKYITTLINNGPKNIRDLKECQIEIDNTVTVPTKYYKAIDYYLGVTNQPSYANITTELYFDGVQQSSTTDGYGILFTFQKADFSVNWDIMSDGSSSGGTIIGETDSTLVYDADTDDYYAKPTADGQKQNLGQELFFRAINNDSVSAYALNPKVFMSLGADITFPKWESTALAKAGDISGGIKFGLNTVEALITGERKFKCTTSGKVNNCNTSLWPVNTVLYVDPINRGEMTTIQPNANIWVIGKVLVQHATVGVIDVTAIGSSRLDKQLTSFSQDDFWFTADPEIVSEPGVFKIIGFGEKGTLAEAIGTVAVNDNSSGSSNIEYLFPSNPLAVLLPFGNYKAFIDVSIDDASATEKITIEAYHADINAVPIDSGIASQPIGSLGVKPVIIYESSALDLTASTVHNIELNGILEDDFTILATNRFRFVVIAEKIGLIGGVKTFSFYSGTSYSSKIEGLIQLNTDDIRNLSDVEGKDVTEALNFIEQGNYKRLTWAGLVLDSTKKVGDRILLLDSTYVGFIILSSDDTFQWVNANKIIQIITIE